MFFFSEGEGKDVGFTFLKGEGGDKTSLTSLRERVKLNSFND